MPKVPCLRVPCEMEFRSGVLCRLAQQAGQSKAKGVAQSSEWYLRRVGALRCEHNRLGRGADEWTDWNNRGSLMREAVLSFFGAGPHRRQGGARGRRVRASLKLQLQVLSAVQSMQNMGPLEIQAQRLKK